MKNKKCNICGSNNWHKNGQCKLCQHNRSKQLQMQTQLDIDNGLYDNKVCDKCGSTGRYNWSNEKRCKNCRKITKRKDLKQTQVDIKLGKYDKICGVCGGNDWNPSGGCRECIIRRYIGRKEIYDVEIVDGYWDGKKCSICGADDSWNSSGQCEICARKNSNKRKNQRVLEIGNGEWEDKTCDKCGDTNWGTTGICKTCEQLRGLKKRVVARDRYENGYYDDKTCDICGESNFGTDGRCRTCNNNRLRQWRIDNPELAKKKERKQKYRRIQRIVENGGNMITIELYNELLGFYGYNCANCGSLEDLQHDHVIPLSQGGDNSVSNAQILCNTCNVRKGINIIDYRFDKGEHFKGR